MGPDEQPHIIECAGTGRFIASCEGWGAGHAEEAWANAQLIATAPHLLAFAERVVRELEPLDDSTAEGQQLCENFSWMDLRDVLYDAARSAIAKAKP